MKATFVRKNWWIAVFALLLVAVMALPMQSALAGDGKFNVAVYHGINGKALDLPKDLPVDIYVWKDGAYLATIENFTFKDHFFARLPAGTYDIYVYLDQSLGGGRISSMTISNAQIPEGVTVRLNATLGAGQTPEIKVRVK